MAKRKYICYKCAKNIRNDALCWWAINNDATRNVPVHRQCWLELRERDLGISKQEPV